MTDDPLFLSVVLVAAGLVVLSHVVHHAVAWTLGWHAARATFEARLRRANEVEQRARLLCDLTADTAALVREAEAAVRR